MGYKNFGCMKTVVLPIPDDVMTINDYKETFGIDLKYLIDLKQGRISLKKENTLFLFNDIYGVKFPSFINVATAINKVQWVSGSNDGYADYFYYGDGVNEGGGIRFVISKDDEFILDNLQITYCEV